ncbi:MAG: tetratricopeptide repeat protein [Candidatus Eiseniibacteriota bacterium]
MRNAAATLAVGLCAFAVYLRTLCPTVYAGDSGELAWAASSLGIAHQPGYPLWTICGRVAVLVSSASPIEALNASSALFAAGAAALLTWILAALTGRPLVSAGIGLAFALSRGVWSQATITEVYSLNLLMFAGVVAAGVAARQRPGLIALSAYLLGLGAANHPLVLAAGPAVLCIAIDLARTHPDGAVRRLLGAFALFVLGLSAYLYLPVRWASGPEMVWGGIRSASDLWDHVTRAQYGGLGEAAAHTTFALRLSVFAGLLAASATGLVLAFALVGAARALRADRWTAALLLLLFVATGPLVAAAVRFEDTFLDRSVAAVYFGPAVASAFLAAGVGIAALDRLVRGKLAGEPRVAVLATALLAVLPPAVLMQRNAAACDKSRSTLGRLYAESILAELPSHARLYAGGDNAVFLLAYFQRVAGLRPDVTLADRTLNLFLEAYGEDFPAMSRVEREAKAPAREVELALSRQDLPVFSTEEFGLEMFGGCRMMPAGLVAQLLRPGEAPAPVRHSLLEMPPIDPQDYLESHLAGAVLFREGRWLSRMGRPQEADARLRAAAEVGREIPALLRNLGLEHLLLGDTATAEARFLESLALEPDDEDALYNMAILCARTDRVEESIEWFDRIVEQGTKYAEVWLNRGIELVLAGRLEEAEQSAGKALELEGDFGPAVQLRDAVRRGIEIGGEAGLLEARRAVEPATVQGTLQLAERYLERGDAQRAAELYREVYQGSTESLEAAYGLGYGLLRLGRVEESAEAFRRVLALDPESAAGRNALAYVFAISGDSLSTAETLAREALELDPGLAAYWKDTLGWVRFRRGDAQGALGLLQESERELPLDDVSMLAENDYHIGVVLMTLGRQNEAKTYLARSLGRAKGEPWTKDLEAKARELGLEAPS